MLSCGMQYLHESWRVGVFLADGHKDGGSHGMQYMDLSLAMFESTVIGGLPPGNPPPPGGRWERGTER